jgi:hypothetical protein
MKEILNEWRKFVNENKDNVKDCSRDPSCTDEEFVAYLDYRKSVGMNEEEIGEEYYIKSMTPTTQEEFLKELLQDAGLWTRRSVGRRIINALLNFVFGKIDQLATVNVVYYKLESSNGEKYFATYFPSLEGRGGKAGIQVYKPVETTGDPKRPFELKRAEKELEAAALKFLQQDAPDENSPRFPEREEN